jgi:hypothetical protein
MMRWRLWYCGCWRCGSCCEWGCGSRSGTRPRDREVACRVSGDRVVVMREGAYGGRGPEIVIGTAIARSFRRGLCWRDKTCRVIKAA